MNSVRTVALLSFLALLLFHVDCKAQEENFIAISIYNFTRYIDWPSSDASGDFVIDIIGHKSVYEKLKELTSGRKVGTRAITVRFLESVNSITQSQILFVGFWQSKDLNKAIDKIGNAHTLIIAEKDGMIDSGAAINFVIRNSAIKFEIKKANIQKYGLSVGEALLGLAFKLY
ncbi:MAG TPA: YfiR family protein [Bacteroidales bacterium]